MNFATGANLGDVILHLQFLRNLTRKLGGEHNYFIKPEYIRQLKPLITDIPVQLFPVEERPDDHLDTWMANGLFESAGVSFRNQQDIVGFLFEWFNHFGGKCGMGSPLMESRQEMLWSIPSGYGRDGYELIKWMDKILVVNSPPTSGQCNGYDHGEVWRLVQDLREIGHSVVTTNDIEANPRFSLKSIMDISTYCRLIICVANGPAFPTFNTLNKNTQRVVFLSPMYLDYDIPARVDCVSTAQEARNILEETGWL